jgi:cephalosporin hydroxylase
MWEKVRHKAWYIYAYLVARRFHAAYYATPTTWEHTNYFGHRIYQYPGDMWLYQEIIVREQPAYIIQTGVAQGGSLLYFAHMLDLLGAAPEALVVGIDIHLSAQARQMTHPRIRLIAGDSIDPLTVEQVAAFLPPGEGMVSLDSAHTYEHVLREIELYQQFVRVGSYLVVEDTNLNGHPVWKAYGAGPYEAVQRFLSTNEQFIRDDEIWRRNLFSFHQYGWLRRVR